MEILPIKSLTDSDSPIFGSLSVSLGKLARSGLSAGTGIVVTAPDLKLKTVFEHYDFGKKEILEQSLTLVKKEINSTAVPQILFNETGKHNEFLVNGAKIKSVKGLWLALLETWIDQIKKRLWQDGFYKGITEGLDSQTVIFIKSLKAWGSAYYDNLQDDSVIRISQGKLHPNDLKKLDEIVKEANKKLFIPHEYEWMVDNGVKLTKILPYTPSTFMPDVSMQHPPGGSKDSNAGRSAIKVFLDMSNGLVVEREADGVYIASEKILDLNEQVLSSGNKPTDSFENLIFKLVESSLAFPDKPVYVKLADKSEGMGKVRGTLRLLHQASLFNPLLEALDFVRHKKGLTNIHIIIPFVRSINEFVQIKRELAVKKLSRKNSLQLWMEAAVPENILNLENYLMQGLDGIVLNLDELISYLGGFDKGEGELLFYKNEADMLLKFLEDALKLMNKSKVPFMAAGTVVLNPKVLDFLVEKGVQGIVVERYELDSSYDLLNWSEKRMILKRSQ